MADNKTARIIETADTLYRSGVWPTERKVRACLGGGSNREINPVLRRWREEGGPARALATAAPATPAHPDDLVPRSEMEAAIARIQELADGERRHLMMETDRVRQEMAAPLQRKIDRLEGELLLARAKIEALQRERR